MQSAKLVADIQQAASNAEASGEFLVNDAACVTVLLTLQQRHAPFTQSIVLSEWCCLLSSWLLIFVMGESFFFWLLIDHVVV